MLVGVDADSVRTEPPIMHLRRSNPLHPCNGGLMATFLDRHGINEEELKQFNPAYLSELSVGSGVRVAKTSPATAAGYWPSISGGASWPNALNSPNQRQPPSHHGRSPSTTYSWPTRGVHLDMAGAGANAQGN